MSGPPVYSVPRHCSGFPQAARTGVCVFGLCRRHAGRPAGCVAGVVRNGGGAGDRVPGPRRGRPAARRDRAGGAARAASISAPAARGAEAALAPRGTLARAGAQPRGPQGARLHQPAGGLVWALQAPGLPGTGTEDRGGRPQLRAPDGPQHGLNGRTEPTCTEERPGRPTTNINEIETVPATADGCAATAGSCTMTSTDA